ncbi:MAG: RiPP maturation radical SAM C-methyltransferase, partial [Crocinitomicaceae bacterium]
WGAISHCTFCGLNGESMSHRSKDQEKFLQELNELTNKYGVYSVEIVDNILDMSYFQKMIPQLALEDKGYDIFYETKSNLNKQKLQLLSDAGIRWLQPGIESLDNTILKMIGKGTSSRINLQLMKWAQEKGIFILWILLYDLPGEEDEPYMDMAKMFPSISHFQPPSGLSFIQINRFSPYQMRPKDYGINLSPDRAYSYVYPWSEQSINDFAYFFDDYTVHRPVVDYTENNKPNIRPGIDAVKDSIGYWQDEWNMRRGNNTDPESQDRTLIYVDKSDTLTIYDSRTRAVKNKYELTGLSRLIYIICDQFRSVNAIQRQLMDDFNKEATIDEIKAILTDFHSSDIVLYIDDQYFSTAFEFPFYRPLPNRHNYPGGRLYSKLEAKNLQILKLADQALL